MSEHATDRPCPTRLHVPVALRWSDLDAYQHVNNVEMLRLLEDARITALWEHPGLDEEAGRAPWPTAVMRTGPGATSHTLVAHQEIEYLRPLEFTRDPVRVELWFGRVGGASVEVCYEIKDGGPAFDRVGPPSASAPYARASTTVVAVDAATNAPRRLTDDERAAFAPFVGDPVPFRRRS